MTSAQIDLDAVLAGTPSNVCKTKVVCTLGPVSRDVDILCQLLRAGMSVARFNFSHGSHDYHQETLDNLRTAIVRTRIMCAILLDTKLRSPWVRRMVFEEHCGKVSVRPSVVQGPEIRSGFLENGDKVLYKAGSEVFVTANYKTKGHEGLIACSYPKIAEDLKPGCQILCADGSLVLHVEECLPDKGLVRCTAVNSAAIGERKNMNLPGVVVDLPTLTAKDEEDLVNWGVKNRVDFIAASFVRKGADLDNIRKVLGEEGQGIHIISKIENQEGIQNFEEVLDKSDGIMVARGDLGMEIPTEKIFLAQKMMIQQCNAAGKPVITATQMLESMCKNPRPTRAEATDVANAVLDGTDCVMLSGETAAGAFPVEAVQVMTKICREAESSLDYYALFKSILRDAPTPMSPLESLASSAVRTAHKVHAKLIIVLTRGGSTARLVAKYRPSVPVLTVAVPVLTIDNLEWRCSGETPARQCLVMRGLVPLLAEGAGRASDSDTTDDILASAIEYAKLQQYLQASDTVVALHRIGNASVIKLIDVK